MELIKRYKKTSAVLAALTVIGVAAYIYQLAKGLAVTGMNNGNSWGLYIMMFMFFVGLSAGGLIVASSASVFHIEKFKKVSLPAVIVSTVCICVAGMFVLIDLGGVWKVWRILTGPNPSSVLVWDICVITCYLVINLVYLHFMCSKKADPKKIPIVSRFALPVAILVHSVTAWIFAMQIAREGWHTAIMAPIFVASAMDSGLALLILTLLVLNVLRLFATGRELLSSLAGLLCTCVAVDGFFIFCELLTLGYNGEHGGATVLGHLTSGATAGFFWFEIIAGLLIPFFVLLFEKNRKNMKIVAGCSVLVVLGVCCKRAWLLFTSFITPNIVGAPGIISGSSAARGSEGVGAWSVFGGYMPTVVEVLVVVGVISLAVLAFVFLVSKLVVEAGKSGFEAEAAAAGEVSGVEAAGSAAAAAAGSSAAAPAAAAADC